jgi:hypothetical protein
LGLYKGYSGVTTNQSEGFNTLLKNLTERKEYTIDSLALALYFLQCYYINEIQRGLAGLGQYSLLEQHKALSISIHNMDLLHCFAPEEIAQKLKEQRCQDLVTDLEVDWTKAVKEEVEEEEVTSASEVVGVQEEEADIGIQHKQQAAETNQITPATQLARAHMVLQNKHCMYQPELKTFVVQGTSCAHAVKLFPKATCTCPAKQECYHILAAKLYMGMETKANKRRITMTQLRRNARPKSSKRKGKKGPILDDEIEPAPDATVSKELALTHEPAPPTPVQDKTAEVVDVITLTGSQVSDDGKLYVCLTLQVY